MSFHVSTTTFEGPLDLLLQLINRHQVDIASVSLTDLVAEYLRHIDQLLEMDLEVTSEFLLIAATLIQLKAHRLLPSGAEIDLDEELALMEERDRLLSRLLMCVTFKDVAAVFLRRWQETNRLVPRLSGLDQEIRISPPEVVIPIDAGGLAALATRVFARLDADPDLDHFDLDLPSVESAIHELRVRLVSVVESTFEEMVVHCGRRVEVAAYFLALLEMARWGLLELHQEDWLAPIVIRPRPGPIASFAGEIDLR
ncbi:MAG: segregation and condensation protein A [Acidimicrobiia bacterium]